MQIVLLLAVVLPAEPDTAQLELLKTFRSEFVSLSPGSGVYPAVVVMGRAVGGRANERPAHRVTLTNQFAIARFEVTQNLWQVVMDSNPSRWQGPRNSCEMFTFDEAREFCRKVTELLQSAKLIEEDEVVRLPSEAEWEYAARAGTNTVYSFGDDPAELGENAWFKGNAAGNDPPVGAKKPNGWGLYDVHGYLWEWCDDLWHANYEGAPTDGSSWKAGGGPRQRVLRGGSWKDPAERLTSSYRRAADESTRDDAVGLRCVLARE